MANAPSVSIRLVSIGTSSELSFFDVYITSSNAALNPLMPGSGTLYDGWCLDPNVSISSNSTGVPYQAYIYSTYEPGLLSQSIPTLGNPNGFLANLGGINWLLNNYTTTVASQYSYGELQYAIWRLMGEPGTAPFQANLLGGTGIQEADIRTLVDQAKANNGYVPDVGEKLGIILDTYTIVNGVEVHSQPLIIETKAAKIGNFVWHDLDADGLQDANEAGIKEAKVELVRDLNSDGDFNDANEILASKLTDANGFYSFNGLTPGLNYQVRFTQPSGFDAVSPRQSDGSAGSGVNSDATTSNVVVLAPGEYNQTIDAGFYKLASLGDTVFDDKNANGIQDAGEGGVAGVTVRLFTCVNDQPGVQVGADIQTDANGNYSFSGLKPGDYIVQFVAANGTILSQANQGVDDAADSDAGTNGFTGCYTLTSGQNDTTVDAGLYQTASIGDTVFDDKNANGIQDAGEGGIAGVTVRLFTCVNDQPGVQVGADIQTDANGNYSFSGLKPGDYIVQFVAANGTILSQANQGVDDAADSDAGTNGFTGCYTLTSGQNDTTVDAGLYQTASIGDTVFDDKNANGIQDAGEGGIAGVTVRLFTCVNDQPGVQVGADIQTDANGNYSFSGLKPGDYIVQFVAANGTILSQANQGVDDAADSDAGTNGFTGCYTLTSGQNDTTVDAGLYQTASIGDTVFDDKNANGIQDAGEGGIAGVTVRLFTCVNDQPGVQVGADIQTDANGNYSFSGLKPGDYIVQFVAANGTILSQANQGVDDAADSDAGTNGFTGCYTLTSGQNDTTVDAGLYQTASIGDTVFDDKNANGIQDAGEGGIAGVTVRLFTCVNDQPGVQVGADIQTDANGNYSFSGLKPGDYIVQFVAANGQILSQANQGVDDAADSDAGTNGFTGCYTLTSGQNDTTVDAGLYQTASIGDTVFDDKNANGIQDAGEGGIAGVTVRLFTCVNDQPGVQVGADIQTDANGNYSFSGLKPGDYIVQFVAANGTILSQANQGVDDAADSDAGTNGFTGCYTLTSGQNDTTVDAGLYQTASIGDTVFDDKNANGIQDAGEGGIAGVTVRLFTCVNDQPGVQVGADIQTDANGNYSFSGLKPGDYIVQFVAANGQILSQANQGVDDAADSDAGTNGFTGCYTLTSGQNDTTVDAGLYQTASIGDTVFDDKNANGIQDAGEGGIAGVTVRLFTCVNDQPGVQVGADIQTDANGNYSFSGLKPGDYIVQFVAANGTILSQANQGVDDAADSDAGTNGFTGCYTLTSGQNDTTVDAGLYQTASIGDTVFDDKNANGIQDAGEGGIAGVTVRLFTCVNDQPGVQVGADIQTDANGNYSFSGLKPGDYIVQFVAANGQILSQANQGVDDAADSDAGTNGFTGCYTLTSGQNDTTVDAGLYQTASIGDTVFDDKNANGIQDAGEGGIAGVTVRLFTCVNDQPGVQVGADIQTDANGNYSFSGLKPGDYIVQFVAANGTILSQANQGVDDAADSDAGTNGFTGCYTLTSGQNDTTVDAGLYQTASIGDTVFDDKNANGIQDAGEGGIAGVTVRLFTCVNDQPGVQVGADIQTDANGNYSFSGLKPGDYIVQFVAANGQILSQANQGVDDAADSDAGTNGFTGCYTLTSGQNDTTADAGIYKLASLGDYVWADNNNNGLQDDGAANGLNGVTVILRDGNGAEVKRTTTANDTNGNPGYYLFKDLVPGEYRVEFVKLAGYSFAKQDQGGDAADSDADRATGLTVKTTLESGENDLSWDAGLVKLASLGNRLWVDADGDGQQDAGEAGISGQTVTLIGGGADGVINGVGDTTATTTTGANGEYRFDGLNVGEQYQVQFSKPAGTVFTLQDAAGDAVDSDVNAAGLTQIVTLAAGQYNDTLDAGVYVPASIGDKVFDDKNANGVQDAGEGGVAGVTVRLFTCVNDQPGVQVGADIQTDANGNYSFSGLKPGDYIVQFVAANGQILSQANQGVDDAADSDAGTNGFTGCYTLTSGQNDTTADAGIYKLASLGDYVWADNNNNGLQDDGAANGLNGVTVILRDGNGVEVSRTTTANDTNGNPGYYLFKDLVPGEYRVEFVKLAGYSFAKQDQGGDAADSDADRATGLTVKTTLESGENDLSWDAGLVKLASLGNRLWVDADGDGQQDAGEAGISGQTVTLIGGGADGVINGVGDTTATTTTGANGEYRFDGLNVGEQYQVQFSKPAGTVFTLQDAAGDAVDSDVNAAGLTQIVTLAAGQYNDTLDAGVIVLRPGIDIEKTTSGSSNSNTTAADYDNEDTANGAGVPILTVGSDVTWTYKVTNTGNTSFAKADVSIVDDNGTVGNTADDMTTANGKVTYQTGDDGDNLLEAGETWFYKATGTVQALNGMGATTTFDFSGNSATDGTDGNVRSYTANGITVNAEAFSRDKGTGAWSEAFLGAFGGGLGVTDSSEGDGASDSTHTVDNTGRDNYIVFQFSQNVVIDKAFLGYVVCDSDLQMWVGNTSSPITMLSNSVLSSMAFTEVNTTTSTAARWAELNAGNVAGNTLIIAADTTDTSPEDFFKLQQLVLQAATTGGVYANKATVTIANDGPSDSDMSHYVTEAAKAKIGDRIWYDKNANGLQDAGEAGISGVTIDLKDAVTKTTVLTTTTDANGNYSFLTKAGDYFIDVREATLPSGFVFTRPNVNGNTSDSVDSDVEIRADQPGATLQWGQMANTNLAAGETDLTWDAGVYKVGIDVEKYVSSTQTTTPDCGGTEGAHSSYWASCKTSTGWSGVTGCTGAESFNQIFGCNFSWGTRNLFDCLRSTGTTATDKFMRECAAAYLNACHDKVDYAYSKEQVVSHTKWCADNAKYDEGCRSYESENTKGCNWTTTKSLWSCVVDTQLYDADAPPGLEVKTGSTVTFTYIVKNTGDTALKNVVLTDDRIATVTYVSGDTDKDGLLDTNETWTYTAKEVASAGTIKNTGTVTAVDSVGGVASVTDKDDAYYTGNGALKSSLGDRVWEDVNGNGLQDNGERGLSGVKVTLQGAGKDGSFGTADDITATTTTGTNGAYLFGSLDAGQYKVTFGGLTGYKFTTADANLNGSDALDSDANATTGTTGVITLGAGQQNLTVDAGLVGIAKLGIDVEKYVSGTLSTTSNNGGSEGGSCGEWVSKCTTTSSMQWISTSWFTGYWAEIKTPSGWGGISGVTGKESFNQIFGCNLAGGTKSIYDILCGTSTVSADKFMRESVAAYLNACHGKVDYAYSKDQVIAHTKWGADTGRYDECTKSYERENTKGCDWISDKTLWNCAVSSDLYDADAPPGLEVKTGSTVTFTYIVKNTGDTALKNVVLTDDRIATVTYVSGDTDKDGLLDTNETWTYTAKEVASAGTIKNTGTVTAADSTGSGRTVTDQDDAYYTGTGALKSSIGDRVWEDKDFDGVQDKDEAGVSGVKVILTGAGKDGVFGTKDDITATTTTNANGLYEFNNLDAGKYTVRFVTGAGWCFTKTDLGGNDAADSDANSSGTTGVITLDANEHDLTVDAGIYRKASVGDRVWQDANHNWVQDAGEVGIAGITVTLLDANGAAIRSTKTDTSGKYLFSELDPGAYSVQFDKSNVLHAGYNMNAWKWAVKDSGSNDEIDSDVTGDGVATTNLTRTSQFFLQSGQTDLSRDAGITPIVIDLDGDGIRTIARADAQGSFDLLGNGKAVVSGWLSGNDGFLAVDSNGNGKIDGIQELFGGNSKGDGFAKLASFDSNGDGVVNDLDTAFGQLLIWRDANGNHSTDAGELMSLAEAGVASLGVRYTELPQLDEQGNLHLERSTATLADGQSVAMTDVYFNVSAEDAAAAGVRLPSMSDLLGNDSTLDSLVGSTAQPLGTLAESCDSAAGHGCGDASEALRRLAALSRADCAHAPAAA